MNGAGFLNPGEKGTLWVLSPHLDDAVLSCGGTLYRMARAGIPVKVITVFAGDPIHPVPPFAQALHTLWGNEEQAMAMRRAEDREALTQLGTQVIHWDLPDVIYRRDAQGQPLCQGREDLFRPIHPDEAPWIKRIREALDALPWEEGDLLLAPLALGGHVDHRLVRAAVEGLFREGLRLGFYEDFPYAETESFAGLPGWQPCRVELGEEDLQMKAAAIRAYRSQWPFFFLNEEEILERIRAYALQVGEGTPAERFWFPPS